MIPFEEREKFGFWNSLIVTWKLAALDAKNFYPLVGESKDNGSALLFALFVNAGGALLSFLLSLPFDQFDLGSLIKKIIQPDNPLLFNTPTLTFTLFSGLSPLFWLSCILYASSLFIHVFLLMVKGAPRGFAATLRALCYAGAPNAIPFVGWIWTSFLVVIALAETHGVEIWRPIVAFLLQFFAFFLAGFALFLMLLLLFLHTYHII